MVKNQYTHNYQAAILDKVERMQSIQEPKIILVGDSNVNFGIQSQMIEESLEMPVVNLGLHGGLGSAFLERIALLGINEGDIVVLMMGNYSSGSNIPDKELAWITIEKHKELWNIVPEEERLNMLKAYPAYSLKAAVNWLVNGQEAGEGTCYARSAFNEYGDIELRPGEENRDENPIVTSANAVVPTVSSTNIARINEYNSYILECGATLVIAGFPVPADENGPDAAAFDAFQAELKAGVQCPVISDFKDYFIPTNQFYDTIYHLTSKGATTRTEQLIKDLENWMGAQELGMNE